MSALVSKYAQPYIVCENFDFVWQEEQVFDFECQWHEGKTLKEMAKYFKRTPEDVLLLALDRAKLGTIKKRKGGLIGEYSRNKNEKVNNS